MTRVISDSPGTGFHDAEFGEARTAALQAALDQWAQRLDGLRSITVEASFAELPCTESSVVVARGESAAHVHLRAAAYPIALARTLSSDVPATDADVRLWFNAALGTEACPGSLPWSLGSTSGSASAGANNLDGGTPPGDSEGSAQSVPLSRVALHELAHGLGLATTLDFTETNPDFAGLPDVFSRHVYSLSFEAPLSELDSSERLVALTTPRDLVFTGPRTRRAAAQLLARGLPRLELLHRLRAGAKQASSVNALDNVAEVLPPGEFARVEGPLVSVAASDLCADNPPASSFGALLLVDAILGIRASAAAGSFRPTSGASSSTRAFASSA